MQFSFKFNGAPTSVFATYLFTKKQLKSKINKTFFSPVKLFHSIKQKGRADEERCIFHIVICQSRVTVNISFTTFRGPLNRGRINLAIPTSFQRQNKNLQTALRVCIIISIRMFKDTIFILNKELTLSAQQRGLKIINFLSKRCTCELWAGQGKRREVRWINSIYWLTLKLCCLSFSIYSISGRDINRIT